MPLTPKEIGLAGGGNYFGDSSDGDVTISSSTNFASTQDGDVVVKQYASLTIDAGQTLSVANRCRGLILFVDGTLTVNGTLSMTGKGAHANPADSTTSTHTPVAPSDANAVPSEGIVLRFLKEGGADAHSETDIGNGLGTAARVALQKFPSVAAGLVEKIPLVGGAGGAYRTWESAGAPGGTAVNGTGGGGSGAVNSTRSGAGSAGTCFSGGSGGGGAYSTTTTDALPYGGAGSPGAGAAAGGGAGNPGGAGAGGSNAGGTGTGGLLIVIARSIAGSGQFQSLDVTGGASTNGMAGGSSGGGIVALFYSDSYTFTGTRYANGGVAASGYSSYNGGPGGSGQLIGPTQIDS